MFPSLLSLLLVFAGGSVRGDAARVVVVSNSASSVSRAIAADYQRRRGVRNAVSVICPDSAVGADKETIPYAAFKDAIEQPIRTFLAAHPKIDFIVLTKGIPLRITDAPSIGLANKQPSVDSFLAALDYDKLPGSHKVAISDSGFTGTAWQNRFWNSDERFSHAKFGGYLVTRLDGYTQADALALVTRALEAERHAPTGTILLDACAGFGFASDDAKQPLPLYATPAQSAASPALADVDYKEYNTDMRCACAKLTARGVPVDLDQKDQFVGNRADLMGYASWGSNDQHYDVVAYHSLKFAPGSVAETAVSTSARTFLPTTGGQSLIADLVAQGVTGVKGYCDEPLLLAVASPTVLFDRYTRGWTLAESFFAASRFVGWEDVVLGDPLCRPYPAPNRSVK